MPSSATTNTGRPHVTTGHMSSTQIPTLAFSSTLGLSTTGRTGLSSPAPVTNVTTLGTALLVSPPEPSSSSSQPQGPLPTNLKLSSISTEFSSASTSSQVPPASQTSASNQEPTSITSGSAGTSSLPGGLTSSTSWPSTGPATSPGQSATGPTATSSLLTPSPQQSTGLLPSSAHTARSSPATKLTPSTLHSQATVHSTMQGDTVLSSALPIGSIVPATSSLALPGQPSSYSTPQTVSTPSEGKNMLPTHVVEDSLQTMFWGTQTASRETSVLSGSSPSTPSPTSTGWEPSEGIAPTAASKPYSSVWTSSSSLSMPTFLSETTSATLPASSGSSLSPSPNQPLPNPSMHAHSTVSKYNLGTSAISLKDKQTTPPGTVDAPFPTETIRTHSSAQASFHKSGAPTSSVASFSVLKSTTSPFESGTSDFLWSPPSPLPPSQSPSSTTGPTLSFTTTERIWTQPQSSISQHSPLVSPTASAGRSPRIPSVSPSLPLVTSSGIESVVERITRLPSDVAHGGTMGPLKGPLTPTAPASPTELSIGGTERSETTAMPLKTTSTAAGTTGVSVLPLRTASVTASEQAASTSTEGTITTTPTISPAVPEMTTTLATRLGEDTSVTVPRETPSSFSREPETTASEAHSPEAGTRPATQTPTAFSDESHTMVSLMTHPTERRMPVSRTTSKFPHSESQTTLSVGTSPGTETALAIPTTTVPPDTPGKRVSLTTTSRTHTGSVKPTRTPPGGQESTASLATDLGMVQGSAIPSPTVSPGVSQMVTSTHRSSGTEASTSSQVLTLSPSQMDITILKETQSGTEVSSAVPTLTVLSGGSHTTTSWATHSVETSPTAPRITPDFPRSESSATPLTTTSLVDKTSPAVSASTVSPDGTNRVTLLGTTSATRTSIPNPTGTPEATSSLATHPGPQTNSAIPTQTASSPGVPGTMTSLTTNSREESGVAPTQMVSPGQPETTAQWIIHPETEASSSVPGTVLASEPYTTASHTSHPAEAISAIPKTTLSVPHSESNTSPFTTTSPEETSSSAVSHSVPWVIMSLVTSSTAVASTSTPTLALSPSGSKVTATSITHPGAVSSSAVPTLSLSPGEPDATASLIMLPTETSPMSPSTVPDVLHTELNSTPLTATSPETEAGSALSTSGSGLLTSPLTRSGTETSTFSTLTALSGQQETTGSQGVHPGFETSSVAPTFPVSPGEPHTTVSLATHSAETSQPVFMTSPSVSHNATHPTTPTTVIPGAEPSPAVSTTMISPGAPDMVASQVPTSGIATKTTEPSLIPSPSQPEVTPALGTSAGTQTSSSIPTLAVSPSISEMTSLVTSFETEPSTTTSVLTVSPEQLDITSPWVTRPGSVTSSAIPSLSVSPSELDTAASWVTHPAVTSLPVSRTTPYFPHGVSGSTPSAMTSPRSEASSAAPPPTISPEVPGEVSSSPTSSRTVISASTASQAHSSSKPETTALLATHPGPSSALPTLAVSPGVPGIVTPFTTSSGTEASTVYPKQTGYSQAPKTTASWVTYSGSEASPAIPTLTTVPGEPNTTTSLVTHSADTWTPVSRTAPGLPKSESDFTPSMATSPGAKASLTVPTTIVSSRIPVAVTSEVTNSGTDTSTATSALTPSLVETETTVSVFSSPEAETTPAVPTPSVLPGEPAATSSVPHPSQTSMPASRTSPDFSHSESHTTPSIASSPRAEASSPAPITIWKPEVVTSQVTPGPPTGTTIPTVSVFPSEPETTALLITHPSAETTTKFPVSTVVLPFLETASASVRPEVEMSTALPTQTASLSGQGTATSLPPSLVTEMGRADVGPTVSRAVPLETASPSTPPRAETSTAMPTAALSPGLSETSSTWVNSPAAEASTSIPTPPLSVPWLSSAAKTTGEPKTVTSWNRESSSLATSVGLPDFSQTAVGPTVTSVTPQTPTLPTTSHREGLSPTATLRTTTVETTHLAATGSSPTTAEITASTLSATTAGSPFASESPSGMYTSTSETLTSATTEVPLLKIFTVNFTITNLTYQKDMGNPGSGLFNSTDGTLQQLLHAVFKNSSIGPLYTGCRLTMLRAEKHETSTRIDGVCTYHSDPTGPRLDREQLYWELSQLTHGITQLGSYSLDRDSLYVNGYHHRYWIPTKNTPVASTFSPGPSTPTTPTPRSTAAGVSPGPVLFTLNFTITNLHYTPNMEHPGSLNFIFTEKVLNRLLEPLFKNTSISSGYSGCRLTLLRNEKNGTTTGVDAVCTYKPRPMGPALERENLYQELSQLTHGVTQLGSYALDTDSLYVNGYNRRHLTPTTNTPVSTTFSPGLPTSSIPSSTGASLSLVFFTLNFTITNLHYEKDMGRPGSELFNTTESILNRLLKSLFHKSSIGTLYSGCRLILLRPEKNRAATKVDAVCTHHPDPTGHELDRKKLYWELSLETHGVTKLGSYTLDRNSLYVNGYTFQASTPTPSTAETTTFSPWTSVVPDHFTRSTGEAPVLVPFTINFTILNLRFEKEMALPSSLKFNFTERVLQKLLQPLFKNSSLGALYAGCRLAMLRPEKRGAATRVDAVCTHHPGPEGFRLDREQLYWELSQMTRGVTRLAAYTLDRDSLYVSGFNYRSSAVIISSPGTPTVLLGTSPAPLSFSSPTAVAAPVLVLFTTNFTILNLWFQEDMAHPGSLKFTFMEKVLQKLLQPLFRNSSLGALYAGCRLALLRPEQDGTATEVDLVCSHRPGPEGFSLDRERLYWELSQMTRGVTHLDAYTLDRDSLYVNGFNYHRSALITSSPGTPTVLLGTSAAPLSFSSPTAAAPVLVPFTINFTILNLWFEEDMALPSSLKFNFTERVLQKLLQPLFKNSSLGALYAGCRLALLSPKQGGAATTVDAVCTHRPGPEGFRLDRERLYWELSQMTHGVTNLAAYTLDRDSLYVNGFNYRSSAAITSSPGTPTVLLGTSAAPLSFSSPIAVAPHLVPFTINFTILNLRFEKDMAHPGSLKFNFTERVLQKLLHPLFKNSSLGAFYVGCRLALLRPEKGGAATKVDAVCAHHPGPEGFRLDRERLYWELSQLTRGVTRLAAYTLDRDSLYVNGFTYHSSALSTSSTGSPTVSLGTSGTPLSISSTTAVSPALVPFTINLTITNLQFMPDMNHPGSSRFNKTEAILQHLLGPLMKATSIGPLFSSCRLSSLRPEKDGSATKVDIICTHHSEPMTSGLDREQLYWELSRETHSVSRLGRYTLDRNSLYVNGYTHQYLTSTVSASMASTMIPTSSTLVPVSTAGPILVPFTINFTIINLKYEKDMHETGSRKFNFTERVLQKLLTPLFKKTSIGPLFSSCRLASLRPEGHGAATGVGATCTHHPDATGPGLDSEKLYWELSHLTRGVTRLGSYSLDQDSLYVNGYTHQMLATTPRTSSLTLTPFTLNFTITDMPYMESMQPPGSSEFSKTEKVLQGLLDPLFKNTSVGLLYSGCRLTLLRPKKHGEATGVDAVCTYHPMSAGPGLDREKLHWELSQLTQGVTRLGPYALQQDSLYVDGYTHQIEPAIPSATELPLVPFTLNFTITNLAYEKDMWHLGSWKFNNTEKVLQLLLRSLFKNTTLGPFYTDCRLTLLRPEKGGSVTRVGTLCTYHPEPMGSKLNREQLYRELSQLTRGATQLGSYTLEETSLYINGYTNRTVAAIPSVSGSTIVRVTINFTITNMDYTEEMGNPGSLKFNTTERILQRQLRLLLNKTSIGPLYPGCHLAALRRVKGGAATGVDILCSFHSTSTSSVLDRRKLYRELSHETHGVTQLGHYALDKESLYINGYTFEGTTATPTTKAVREELLTVNFTINNLRYSVDMGHPGSPKFSITDTVMQHLLSPLLRRSSLGARHTGCKLEALRSVKNGAQTQVDMLCTYHQPTSSPGLSAKQVFHELSWQTRGITRLGPYSLDKDSLYLNGYNEPGPEEPPTTPAPATTFLPSSVSVQPEVTPATGYHLKTLTLNFTISNLGYSPDMSNRSAKFNSTERILQYLLRSLFQNTSLGSFYTGCWLSSLRPEKDSKATGVDVTCTYRPDPMGSGLDSEQLYWELRRLTHSITQLGNFSLDQDSLYVNGYTNQTSTTPPSGHVTQNVTSWSEYQLSFHVLNWNLSSADAASSEYSAFRRDIEDKVTALYLSSQLEAVFQSCLVTNFTLDSKVVTVKLFFSTHLDPDLVKQVFLNKTLNASSHWLGATYQLTGLHVTEVKPSVTLPTEMPPTASSSQQFQLNFTITNLPYSQAISQPDTPQHQRNKRSIESALNQLFRNSSIKSYFSDCRVSAFRSVSHMDHTGVDSMCNFSPLARRLDKVAIYEEFLRLTQGGTHLQNFTLDKDSVLVDGYSPIKNDAVTGNYNLPFWAIILICLAGLLALITCLLCCYLVTICRRKKEGDYQVQRHRLGYYFPHLDLRKLQ
ncbi:mucin-16 [Octodon degus]|uniref:Mucin-16 n=1 Tax=Octodon degus TaxID=10160 RepID=A0A6P6DLH1_OCTDE|nr:mucin-16 [Octodon degus]